MARVSLDSVVTVGLGGLRDLSKGLATRRERDLDGASSVPPNLGSPPNPSQETTVISQRSRCAPSRARPGVGAASCGRAPSRTSRSRRAGGWSALSIEGRRTVTRSIDRRRLRPRPVAVLDGRLAGLPVRGRSASATSAPGSPPTRWSPAAASSTRAASADLHGSPSWPGSSASPASGPRASLAPPRGRRADRLVRVGHRLPRTGRRRRIAERPRPTPSAGAGGRLAIPRRVLRHPGRRGPARARSPPPWASCSAASPAAGPASTAGAGSRPPGSPGPSASSLRQVKAARRELVALGWIAPEPSDQWAMNRWGRAYRIDLGWAPAARPAGAAIGTPSRPAGGPRLPPPDLDREPLREMEEPGTRPRRTGWGSALRDRRGRARTPPEAGPAPAAAAGRRPGRGPEGHRPAARAARPGGGPGRGRPRARRTGCGSWRRPSTRWRSGRANPPGLFAYLVRGRSLALPDRGRRGPGERRGSRPTIGPAHHPGSVGRPEARVGRPGDLPAGRRMRRSCGRCGRRRSGRGSSATRARSSQRLNPGWTRERWDRAVG